MKQKLQNLNHQEFTLGESLFILYIDDRQNQQPKPTKCNPKKVKPKSQPKDQTYRVRRICQLTKQQQKTPSQSKKTPKVARHRKNPHPSKQNNGSYRVNIVTESTHRNTGLELRLQEPVVSKNENKQFPRLSSKNSYLNADSKQNSRRNNNSMSGQRKSCFGKVEEKLKTNRPLNHQDIKKILGPHHQFYIPQIDYLVKYNPKTFKNQLMQLQEKENNLNNQLLLLKSHQIREKRSLIKKGLSQSHYYQFNVDRAEIVKYLNGLNAEGKSLYSILIQRKADNERYVDEEFNSKTLKKQKKQKLYWHHLEPKPEIQLFPSNFAQNLIKSPEKGKNLPFVSFLNSLSVIQPQVFMRLYEPPFHNVFSLWLFIKGKYEPIYVDGDFPFDEEMNPLHGYTEGYPWYSILLKCFAKIYNSYSYDELSKIKPCQLYQFFTGVQPKILKIEETQNTEEIYDFLRFKTDQSPVFIYEEKCQIIREANENTGIIRLANPEFKIERSIKCQELLMHKGQILLLNLDYNWFVYSYEFVQGNMTKFDLECNRKTQLMLQVTATNENNEESSWAYLYEHTHIKNKGQKMLNLRHQIQLEKKSKISIKRGNYSIFLETGKKKIGQFFSEEKNENQTECKQKKIKHFTVFASQQVKISKGSPVGKNSFGKFAEDSFSLYCPSDKRGGLFE